jgi:predicted MFS family arabinose efflux permease
MSPQAAIGSPVRNIGLLAAAQAVNGSNQAIVMSIAALTGAAMLPDKSLATLPVTLMIVGTALTTAPAALLIHGWGRRNAFMFASAVAVPAALIAGWATIISSFWLFCAALAVFGATAAFAQQYRFAAADSVPVELKPRAISWVLFGGVAAGFIGPPISALTKDWLPGATFGGTYVAMGGLALVAIGFLALTRLAPTAGRRGGHGAGRPLGVLLRSPSIVVPMIAAAISYSLMVLVMVAAPLAMVYDHGHSTTDAAFAIQWHIVAMFAPSFVTGAIVARIGAGVTAALGLLLIAGAAAVNLQGISVLHFDVALILLGVGWNFSFIAATAMLATAYAPEEAARVQGLNEQVVFGSMAIASIGSGVLLEALGWQAINILAIPVAGLAIVLIGVSVWRARPAPA